MSVLQPADFEAMARQMTRAPHYTPMMLARALVHTTTPQAARDVVAQLAAEVERAARHVEGRT